jgi:surface antigen
VENIPNETLMAYADDALPPDQMRRISALVTRDPALAARLQPYIVTRAALPQIFSDARLGPVPSRLLDTVMTAPIGVRKKSPKAIGFLTSWRDILFPETLSFGRTLALCGTFLAVAGTGWIASRIVFQSDTSLELIAVVDGQTLARGALASALETAPMLKQVTGTGGQTATPVVTFHSAEGRLCRQFEAMKSNSDVFSGYACRDDSGQWQVGFQGPGPSLSNDGMTEAIRPADRQPHPELDAAIDNIIAGDALDVERERALIANGWKRNTHD